MQGELAPFVRSRAEKVDFVAVRDHSGHGSVVKLGGEADSFGCVDLIC